MMMMTMMMMVMMMMVMMMMTILMMMSLLADVTADCLLVQVSNWLDG